MPDTKDVMQNSGKDKKLDNNYWRSFKELYNDPGFLAEKKFEFKEGADESPDPSKMSTLSRRKFLTLLGASAS